LYARAVAVTVQADPAGDYKNLLTRPATPTEPPKGCSKAEKNDYKKQTKKCTTWNDLNKEFVDVVTPRVKAAIHAAETTLGLTGPVTVLVKSTYHYSATHDDLHHWTFSFSAPKCGGRCVGHAYEAGAARKARIWSAAHVQLYNVSFFSKISLDRRLTCELGLNNYRGMNTTFML